MKTSRTIPTVLIVSGLLLAACNSQADASFRSMSESYLRSNIGSLSPRRAPAGSSFTVQKVEWVDGDTAMVTYGYGQTTYRGTADFRANGTDVSVTNFRLESELNSSSSSSDENGRNVSSLHSSIDAMQDARQSSVDAMQGSQRSSVDAAQSAQQASIDAMQSSKAQSY